MAMIFTRDLIRAGKLERTFATCVGVARSLSAARPTNTTMRRTLDRLLSAYTNLDEAMERVEADVHTILAGFDRLYHRMGRLGATIFEKDCSVLTTCFGEHTLPTASRTPRRLASASPCMSMRHAPTCWAAASPPPAPRRWGSM